MPTIWDDTTVRGPISQPPHRTSLLGPLSLVTATSGQVLTLQSLKDHIKVTTDDEDQLLREYLDTATRLCEELIDGHRQFLAATYDVPVECFWEGLLRLPRPPLASVTHLKYYDTNGTQQTLASTYYTVRTPWRQPGTIERAPNQVWPSVETDRNYPITIRIVTGYGAMTAVPPEAKQAVKMVATRLYESRGCIDDEILKKIADYLEVTMGYGSYR